MSLNNENDKVPVTWGNFVPYGSIENLRNATKQFKIDVDVLNSCEWIATEKIDGVNFSFHTNGHEIKCARRNDFLEPNEKFNDYQSILEKYKTKVLSFYKLMQSKNLIKGEMIVIYGELFGGKKTGVYYSPKKDFMIFDVFDGLDLIDFDIMEELLNEIDLQPLIRDNYQNIIKYNPKFITTIPNLLGCSPPSYENIAEGIVIKPVKNIRTSRGDRVIIKIKPPEFEERTKNPEKSNKKSNKEKTPIDIVKTNLFEFINKNRLNSVISKLGTEDKNDEMKLANLLYDDAMVDFMKDEELKTKFLELPDNKKEIVKRAGVSKSSHVIKEHLKSLLSDE
ncbi:RNA ligase [Gigaspora margarita]|uniref:RNA ligase n=1 Tax=Gigaspora margarita TaxID=4874 RepID=A0A8H4ACG8_GIGMA|nr:RNA ligase [Gigaspora margarita]